MFSVLLDKRENTRRYYTMGFAEVLVDLCRGMVSRLRRRALIRPSYEPWSVRVMDCSSFSSSSVAERLRETDVGRDIFCLVRAGWVWFGRNEDLSRVNVALFTRKRYTLLVSLMVGVCGVDHTHPLNPPSIHWKGWHVDYMDTADPLK